MPGTSLQLPPASTGYFPDSVALWPGAPTSSAYYASLTGVTTNSAGNVTFETPLNTTNDLDLLAIPPASNTSVGQGTLSSLSVTGDTTFTLSLPSAVTFQGVLQTSRGEPIPNANVQLSGSLGTASVQTSSTGAFSLSVVPGDYGLAVAGSGSGPYGQNG